MPRSTVGEDNDARSQRHRPERPASGDNRKNVSRRRFLGYLVAAPTLVVAAEIGRQTWLPGVPQANAAAIPSPPLPAELYDLLDLIRDSARPTANLIRIEVNRDGTVSFALPRSDNGQGIITSTQMIIAEEMNLDPDQVIVTLADARPELVFNQLTGGSTTTFSTYTPIRVAAALAQKRLLDAAANELRQDVNVLRSRQGLITGNNGEELPFGELTELASSSVNEAVDVVLKDREEFTVIGTPGPSPTRVRSSPARRSSSPTCRSPTPSRPSSAAGRTSTRPRSA